MAEVMVKNTCTGTALLVIDLDLVHTDLITKGMHFNVPRMVVESEKGAIVFRAHC